MNIELAGICKRYSSEWILRNVDYQFVSNKIYGVRGANGSGKSTLIKLISGFLSPTAGKITYDNGHGKEINKDNVFKYCSFWGPHVDLFPQLTVSEMIHYYWSFKHLRNGLDQSKFRTLLNLPVHGDRSIQSLSSGQSQRLGLALSILSDSKLLLLDEPGSFLDEESLKWLTQLIRDHREDRLVIIASNEQADLSLATETIRIEDYK